MCYAYTTTRMKNFKTKSSDRSKSYDKKPDYKYNKPKSFGPKYESNSYEKKSYGPSVKAMHATNCSECGDACEVPFRPSGDKPVFCAVCFGKKRLANRGDQGDRRPNKDFGRLKSKRDNTSTMNIKMVDHTEEIRVLRTEISTLHSKIEAVTVLITEMQTRELIVREIKDEVKKPAKKVIAKEVKVKAEKVKSEKVKEVKPAKKSKTSADKPAKKVTPKKVAVKAPLAKKVAPKKVVAKKGTKKA